MTPTFRDAMIPKRIHQILNTDVLPNAWQDFVWSWHKFNPDWEYKLWTLEDRKAFLRERRPDLLPAYNRFKRNVQKADLFRYVVLSELGGVYADLDAECLQPFEPLVRGHTFIAGKEPPGHGSGWGFDYIVGNAVLASTPRHPFLEYLIDHVVTLAEKPVDFASDVLVTTGTHTLTAVCDSYPGNDITVVPAKVFYNFGGGAFELFDLFHKTTQGNKIREQLTRAGGYAIHYWWGTWVDGFKDTKLINPDPEDIDGFTFFRGVDSPGFNTEAGKRDVRALADHARRHDNLVGFNTRGMMKGHIRPRSEWVKIRNAKPNEGLYLKEDLAKRIPGCRTPEGDESR
jgi:hypothetical protein